MMLSRRATAPLPGRTPVQHTRSCARPRPGAASSSNGARRRVLRCAAAASDQKSPVEPMYLSDLITFESDVESGSSDSPPSSSSSSSSGSSLDAAAQDGADPTARAQDIINRATEVLAAARAALATPAVDGTTSSSKPAAESSSSSPRAGVAPAAARPAAAAAAAPASSAPSRQAGLPTGSSSSGSPAASTSSGGSSDGGEALTRRWSPLSEDQDLTRHVLQSALDQMQKSGAPIAAPRDDAPSSSIGSSSVGSGSSRAGGGSGGGASAASAARASASAGPSVSATSSSSARSRDIRSGRGGAPAVSDDGHSPAPSWAQSLLGSSDDFGGSAGYSFPTAGPSGGAPAGLGELPAQLKLQQASQRSSGWGWADSSFAPLTLPPAALTLPSQSELDAAKARSAVLPPLQSVLELTTAFRPPERTGAVPSAATATAEATDEVAATPVGRALPDGSGHLADGTWWEKKSGIEYGKNGYWKRWQLLKGGNAEGTLEWEETWWEASDYTGLKEMGAEKKGRNTDGAAWHERWTERLMYASNDLDCVVERNAHKWAAEPNGDEWEEKWGEHYHVSGKVAKFADKWGKTGSNVWHERWGEDYDSSDGGDACVKWTDKWAERLLPGGAREQWGDKWREAFASGRGEKNGEVWSVGADGGRYQRWWGEQHLGDQRVRRFGHSTTGDSWDDTITMDTYYNPVPHFGFKLALDHSPQLRGVPLKPKEVDAADPFGPGLDDL